MLPLGYFKSDHKGSMGVKLNICVLFTGTSFHILSGNMGNVLHFLWCTGVTPILLVFIRTHKI